MKQLILAFSIVVAFLCGQTSAGATAVAVSYHGSFTKTSGKATVLKLTCKIIPSGKEAQYPSFSKKRRLNKCHHQEFIICHFSEIQFTAQQPHIASHSFIPNKTLSVQFLPNGKRGPPSRA